MHFKRILISFVLACMSISAFSQTILFIDYNNSFSSDQQRWGGTIYNYLVATRPAVTRVATVPATINPATYSQVWLYGNPGAITTANMNPILAYIRAGGAFYIQSEVSCCPQQAAFGKAVIDSVVTGGTSIVHNPTKSGKFLYSHTQTCCPQWTNIGWALRPFTGVPAANIMFQITNNCGAYANDVCGVMFASCDMKNGQGAMTMTGDFNMFVRSTICTGNAAHTQPLATQPVDHIADLMMNLVNCSYTCAATGPNPVNLGNDTSICGGDSILLSSGTGGVPHQWSTGDTTTSIYASTPGTYYVDVGTPPCQVTDTIVIQVGAAYTGTTNTSICQGDSVFAKGQWQHTTGMYVDTITLPGGCDSIFGINLTVNPVYNSTLTPNICQGDSAFAGGAWQTSTGTYLDNLTTAAGCDSTITTNLTVHINQALNVNQTICQGQTYFAGGAWQSTSGLYYDSLQTSNGCDSVVTTSLVVNPVSSSNNNINICNGTSYNFFGNSLTTAGTYTDTVKNGNSYGCDSVVIINLVVDPSYSNTVTNILCEGDSFYVGTGYVTTGGTFIANMTTGAGCDSNTTYVLTYYPRVPLVLRSDTTLCLETQLSIGVNVDMDHTYQWNTGSSGATMTVEEPGNYQLTATHKYCPFVESDDVIIDYKDCNYHIYIPNTFTPTGEGLNDRFGPKFFGEFDTDNYYFAIFNKWGELLFETNDMNEKWNGKIKNDQIKTDTYVWKLRYKPVYGDEQSEIGRVTLLK